MRGLFPALALVLAAAAAQADAPLIVLDQTRLPFDLGPGHPANNPASPANSPHAAWNSSGNPANAASTWQNRPSNPDNETRLIITADGGVRGGKPVYALEGSIAVAGSGVKFLMSKWRSRAHDCL